jgi:hypothetical protein
MPLTVSVLDPLFVIPGEAVPPVTVPVTVTVPFDIDIPNPLTPVTLPIIFTVALPVIERPNAPAFMVPAVRFPVWLKVPVPVMLTAVIPEALAPTMFPVKLIMPAVENTNVDVGELAVCANDPAIVATVPTPRFGVVTQTVPTAPWSTPFAFVTVKLHPSSNENVPPAVMPVPLALLIACTVRVSLIVTVNVLANATSPDPGTTPPTQVAVAEKSPDAAARMSAIGYTFSLMNA